MVDVSLALLYYFSEMLSDHVQVVNLRGSTVTTAPIHMAAGPDLKKTDNMVHCAVPHVDAATGYRSRECKAMQEQVSK